MYSFLDGKEAFDKYIESYGLSSKPGKHLIVKCHEIPPYYVRTGKPSYSDTIEPSKIVGFDRDEFVIGESVFNNLFNLIPTRYERILSIIEKKSVSEFIDFFAHEQSMSISADHALDTDEYYIHSDGNHRSSLAACLGIPNLYISHIHEYKCNEELKQKYLTEVNLNERLHIICIREDQYSYEIEIDYKGKRRVINAFRNDILGVSFEETMAKLEQYVHRMIRKEEWLDKLPAQLRFFIVRTFNISVLGNVTKRLFSTKKETTFFKHFYERPLR